MKEIDSLQLDVGSLFVCLPVNKVAIKRMTMKLK